MTDSIQMAVDQMRSLGLDVNTIIPDGDLHRVPSEGDKGAERSGWYVAHRFHLANGQTVIVGCYGNWKISRESQRLQFDAELSSKDLIEVRLQRESASIAAAAKKAEQNRLAATKALRIWTNLFAKGQSNYLNRKKIHGYACRYSKNSIVIPVLKGGRFTGLQYISDDGSKKFLKGTAKRGASFMIEGEGKPGLVVLCEGYATGCSIRMATGFATIVCFDADNLLVIAGQVSASKQPFMVAADNDHSRTVNKGLEVAWKIYQKYDCTVRWPIFMPDDPGTDFNDLHIKSGLDAVTKTLMGPPQDFPGRRH